MVVGEDFRRYISKKLLGGIKMSNFQTVILMVSFIAVFLIGLISGEIWGYNKAETEITMLEEEIEELKNEKTKMFN